MTDQRTYFIWTCPDCSFTTLERKVPPQGNFHPCSRLMMPGQPLCAPTPYSYVEVGEVIKGPGRKFYMKLPPEVRRKRRSV